MRRGGGLAEGNWILHDSYIFGPRKGPSGPFGIQKYEKCKIDVTKTMLHLFDISRYIYFTFFIIGTKVPV